MFKGKVILVVDDETDLREILRDELAFEGAQVFEAPNGEVAWELCQQVQFDAVLSDIRMPGGDGVTLARRIRERSKDNPVIILITGFADITCEEAFHLGADGYVLKPFHLRAVKSDLQRLFQPAEKRWATNGKIDPGSAVLRFDESLGEWISSGRCKLGRGGFFLAVKPGQLRAENPVTVQFSGVPPIGATIRWVRSEAVGQLPAGVGLEFFHVSEQILAVFDRSSPQWKNQKSFIPQS